MFLVFFLGKTVKHSRFFTTVRKNRRIQITEKVSVPKHSILRGLGTPLPPPPRML